MKADVAAARKPLLEVALGDAELIVREHPQGDFTLHLNDEQIVVTAEQLQTIVGGFVTIGHTKGWTCP